MFSKSNAEFVYKEYPMGHEISGESLADVCDWLQKKLDKLIIDGDVQSELGR